jgi:hypothetical protein
MSSRIPFAFSLVLLVLAACGADAPPAKSASDATAAAPTGPSPAPSAPGGCSTNADCGEREFCSKADGDCGGAGKCTAIPAACPRIASPVCGCDGKAYGNGCEATLARSSVKKAGGC